VRITKRIKELGGMRRKNELGSECGVDGVLGHDRQHGRVKVLLGLLDHDQG